MSWKETEMDEMQCFSFFALQSITKEKAYDYISQNKQTENIHDFEKIPVVEKKPPNNKEATENTKE